MLQQALQKIQAELAEKPKDKYVQVIGSFLMDHVRNHPDHAPFILVEGKSIAGSLNAMKEEARKNQSNGVGVLTDEEGFAIVLKYFAIEAAKEPAAVVVSAAISPTVPTFEATLDDLL